MRVLVFGGTTEGRKLSAALERAGIDVTLSVATEFGRDKAEGSGLTILADRLDEESMVSLLEQGSFDSVVDATHPYAVIATQNIRRACELAELEYLRLLRTDSEVFEGITYVSDENEAVRILNESDEKILLTTGSKNLESFTQINNYKKRVFARILPLRDSLDKALELGFCASNIICMQGPFDAAMNQAMLNMTGASLLVTKDSGDIGGFEAKVTAALALGCEVIVITRPVEDEGYTMGELIDRFEIEEQQEELAKRGEASQEGSTKLNEEDLTKYGEASQEDPPKPNQDDPTKPSQEDPPKPNQEDLPLLTTFFPLFIDLQERKVLVIGGGTIADRRIRILQSFGASMAVISPRATNYIQHQASLDTLQLIEREYQNGDVASFEPFFVLAATDVREVNQAVMEEAKSLNIPISVADCREESTCYFPAIAESDIYLAGLVSKNGDHNAVRRIAEKMRELLST